MPVLAGGSTEEGVATIQVGTVATRQVAQKEGLDSELR